MDVVIRTQFEFVETFVSCCNLDLDGYSLSLSIFAHNNSGSENSPWSFVWFYHFVERISANATLPFVYQPLPLRIMSRYEFKSDKNIKR